jgi:tetratricopeptide (TPR) repeat protein
MLSKLKHPAVLVTGAAVVAMVLIFVSVYDWGGSDSDRTKVTYRNTQRTVPVTVSQSLPSTVDSPAATTEPEPVEEVTVAEPEPPREVTYEEAEAAFFAKNYDQAVSLFTSYTERKSENPWGYYMLGLSAWKAGSNEDAETAFGHALELDQKHVKSWINLSRVLLDSSRPSEALARLDEALALDPQSNAAYRLRGRAFQQLARVDEAADAYRRAIQIDDSDAWSMNNLGLLFIEEGRIDAALPALARAVELREDASVFFNNLGMALELTGRFRAAEETYAKAIAVDESNEKAYANFIRVEAVIEDPAVEPVDLAALAQAFVDEIENWKVAAADTDTFVKMSADSIVVSEATISAADTTATDQER